MAGIYRNQTEGIISLSSDGTTRITIADKNLGATQVYNSGDALSEANAGKFYQWGNNYGFPYTGATSIQGAQINASTYGPNNYYSNFVWVNYTGSWDSSDNQDLRGDTTNTLSARKGPCDEGYHIMSESEMVAFISAYKAITGDNNFANVGANLMLPLSYRTIANVLDTTEGDYWCSTPYNSYGRCLTFTGAYSVGNNIRYKSFGHHIRPFKNEAVEPDRTWTKLYGDDLPLPPFLKWFIKNGNYYYFGDAPIHISGLALDKSEISLTTVGQTEQLTATISPEGAVETKVVWSSSDETIATVSQTGLVTCVTPGECTITATCGGYSASCSVIQRKDVYADFLLVGGGAGGSGNADSSTSCGAGKGGSAGGVLYCSNTLISPGTHTVFVGSGGAGKCSIGGSCCGCPGGMTCFSCYYACGGTYQCSGGYGTIGGTCYNGYASGNNCNSGKCTAGGGGAGSRGIGCNAYSYALGGNGGIGYLGNISGTSQCYAGGGGGGSNSSYACGCYGGGNGGGPSSSVGAYGKPGTTYGSGGGGGLCSCAGGNGCQGVAILRYPTACGYDVSGGTCYICGDYTIHCFTSSGTLTVN